MADHAHTTDAQATNVGSAREGRGGRQVHSRRAVLSLAVQGAAAFAAIGAGEAAQAGQPITGLSDSNPLPLERWQAAQLEAHRTAAELEEARRRLAARIGPRGATVGSLDLPDGSSVPIHISDPETARRFWRRLPRELSGDEAARWAFMGAVRAACARWDAEARGAGLPALERQAAGARERARALLARHVQAAVAPLHAMG